MSDSSKPGSALSSLSLKRRLGSPRKLAEENDELRRRNADLQTMRDEALQRAHRLNVERDRLAGRLVAMAMRAQEAAEDQAAEEEVRAQLTERESQLEAASSVFWQDRAKIAALAEQNRLLRGQLDALVRGVYEIAGRAGAALVRGDLLTLIGRR